jgi:cell division septation protein DedD
VNVERQDIGVTLRVTPQITEGNSLRLEIFQEITEINSALQSGVGNVNDVGPALSNRRVENTVVVSDGETVVIGGLLSDKTDSSVIKAPWFGDIPVIGWAFKSTKDETRKTNLLVFLTPRIVRTPLDLENDSIRRRQEYQYHSGHLLEISEEDMEEDAKRYAAAKEQGIPYQPRHYEDPVKERWQRTPRATRPRACRRSSRSAPTSAPRRTRPRTPRGPEYIVQAATLSDPDKAAALLTDLIDSGHDGTLVSSPFGDTVVYEILLGPFATLQQANSVGEAGEALARTHARDPGARRRRAREEAMSELLASPRAAGPRDIGEILLRTTGAHRGAARLGARGAARVGRSARRPARVARTRVRRPAARRARRAARPAGARADPPGRRRREPDRAAADRVRQGPPHAAARARRGRRGARRGHRSARHRLARRPAPALRRRRHRARARHAAHDPRRDQRGVRPRSRARPTRWPATRPKTCRCSRARSARSRRTCSSRARTTRRSSSWSTRSCTTP